MEVIICGGEKSINIVKAVGDRLKSTVKFNIVEDITKLEKLKSIIARVGEIDRIVFVEHFWTVNGSIVNEEENRVMLAKLSKFIENNRNSIRNCVFLVADESMAEVVDEETYNIYDMRVLICKERPYTASFLLNIITADIVALSEFIYKSKKDRIEFGKPVIELVENVPKVSVEISSNDEIGRDSVQMDMDDIDEDFYDVDNEQVMRLASKISGAKVIFEDNGKKDSKVSAETAEDEDLTDIEIEENFKEFVESANSIVKSAMNNEIDITDGINNKELAEDIDEDTEDLEGLDSLEDKKEVTGDAEKLRKLSEKMVDGAVYDELDDFSEEQYEMEGQLTNEKNLKEESFKVNDEDIKSGDESVSVKDSKKIKKLFTKFNRQDIEGVEKIRKLSLKEKEEKLKYSINSEKTNKIKSMLNNFNLRGTSILVTGAGGSGASVFAYNIASIIAAMNFTVLLVDFDLFGRTQAYISSRSFKAVHSLDSRKMSLKYAIGTIYNGGLLRYCDIVREGFNLLTIGLGTEVITLDKLAEMSKINKLDSIARNYYTVIIYDMPFDFAVKELDSITFSADNIVIVVENSAYGLMKVLLKLGNIEKDEVMEMMFGRGQLVFNKVTNRLSSRFGGEPMNFKKILNNMDNIVKGLTGVDGQYSFSDMVVSGYLPYFENLESYWFGEKDMYMDPNMFGYFENALEGVLSRADIVRDAGRLVK